jgi:hypothetical protein
VRVDANKRRTIITILNYDAYNPTTATEAATEAATDTGTEPGSETVTTTEQNGELGSGSGKSASLIPTDAEVEEFCKAWPGEMATGIPPGIPAVWWTRWLSWKLGDQAKAFPVNWPRVLVLAFKADWRADKWDARGAILKKNGAAAGAGEKRERGEILQELEAARAEKNGGRVAELQQELKQCPTQ